MFFYIISFINFFIPEGRCPFKPGGFHPFKPGFA